MNHALSPSRQLSRESVNFQNKRPNIIRQFKLNQMHNLAISYFVINTFTLAATDSIYGVLAITTYLGQNSGPQELSI